MSTNDAVERWGEGVEISPPQLYALDFSYPGAQPVTQPFSWNYGLSMTRFELLRLGVEFSIEAADTTEFKLRVAYRMVVTLKAESPEGRDPENALRTFAARLAPLTMYPFIREAILSVTQKAMLPNFVLPIQNVGAFWKPEDLQIGEAPEIVSEAEAGSVQ